MHTKGEARTNLRFVTKVSHAHAHTKGITFGVGKGKGLGEHTNRRFDPLLHAPTEQHTKGDAYNSTICKYEQYLWCGDQIVDLMPTPKVRAYKS